ncbi:MAG TPA: NAD(P)H-quinone oxidoreductase [Gemmatimonadales bacterium]|nr:NAD(P)H-quinone oxidoreductase [Gemmatimonadales bacterium]
MRALIYQGAGGSEVMRIVEVPRPAVGPGQIRVQVGAAGLNRADILQRQGRYPAPHGWPADIPGLEYAGRVEAVRPGVTRWKVGDRVMGLVGGGACAEEVVVNADEAMAVPSSLTDAEAAAIPEAFLTAYDALVIRARVQSKERVLIHAAASGVGTAAVQIAHELGAIVIGTSRSADKLARMTVYGLDHPIDTSRHPIGGGFREAVGQPVNAILDVLGGPALADNLAILAPRGRLVLLGFLAGSRSEVDLAPVLAKRLEIIGAVMRTRSSDERAALVADFARNMLPLFDRGELRPVVDRVVAMQDAAVAHAAMEHNESFGKIILSWDAAGSK